MYGTWNLNKISLKEGGVAFNTQGCVRTALQPFMKTQYDYWKEAHDQVMAEMAATMKYQLLDTRLNEYFKYGIRVKGMLDFHAVRNWFGQTYGPCESLAHGNKIDNTHWSYEVVYQNYTVYVRGDEELSWFKIKYGDPV